MSEERPAGGSMPAEEFDQVPEHLDDEPPGAAPPAAVKPGGPLRFARMTGSSIAGRDAAAWVTDFLKRRLLPAAGGGTRC